MTEEDAKLLRRQDIHRRGRPVTKRLVNPGEVLNGLDADVRHG